MNRTGRRAPEAEKIGMRQREDREGEKGEQYTVQEGGEVRRWKAEEKRTEESQ